MTPAFPLAGLSDLFAPPPDSPDTIHVTTSYTLNNGDSLDLTGSPGFKLEVRPGSVVSLDLEGVVVLHNGPDNNDAIGVLTSHSHGGDADITIGSTGVLQVFSDGREGQAIDVLVQVDGAIVTSAGNLGAFGVRNAVGLESQAEAVSLTNTGAITARSGFFAYGMFNSGAGGSVDNEGQINVKAEQATGIYSVSDLTNNGEVRVNGQGTDSFATGLSVAGADVSNDGLVRVRGEGYAVAASFDQISSFTNTGALIAASTNDFRASIGMLFSSGTGAVIHNDGLIKGDVSVMASDLFNHNPSGTDDILINTGKLVGDVMLGGGNDSLDSTGGQVLGDVYGGLGDDSLVGSGHADTLFGDAADGSPGAGGNDLLRGLGGADVLSGGDGNDTLIGGAGGDDLTGGAGVDVFQFNRISDAPGFGATDTIEDLESGDVIDLSRVDGDSIHGGFQPFHQVASFTGNPGELTIFYDGGTGLGSIAGDTDGDGDPDFVIKLVGDHTGYTNFVF